MSSLVKALSSSVGKKFVMGFTGLLLCGFLVAHLAGNLLLYIGPEAYNKYAHTLHSQPALLIVAEVILGALFVTHILLALKLTQENRAARGHGYELKVSKLDAAPHTKSSPVHPEAWMFTSGSIVLFFLIVHLLQFTWQRWPWFTTPASEEPFDKAIRILQDNFTSGVYLIGVIILGIHLWHGFASAFQSLGITHPKYAALIKWVGVIFACVMAVGFASFVIFARMATGTGVGH